MSYDITGTIIEKFDTVVVSEKFQKREFVIEVSNHAGDKVYTEEIKFQLTQDRCDELSGYEIGNDVIVHFNIRGRRWEKDGKTSFFTNLDAWRLEAVSDDLPQEERGSAPSDSDDLPF